MDCFFICSACGAPHSEPGDASLGHRVICLDCSLAGEIEAVGAESPCEPIAA